MWYKQTIPAQLTGNSGLNTHTHIRTTHSGGFSFEKKIFEFWPTIIKHQFERFLCDYIVRSGPKL